MGKPTLVPVTPEVLTWAIKESSYSPEVVAELVGVPPAELAAWQKGSARPTLTKFRKLARVLKRTPATFLLPAAPPFASYAVRFRHPPGSQRRSPNPEERRYLREAARLQEASKWLTTELHQEIKSLPSYRLEDDPESTADAICQKLVARTPTDRAAWTSAAQAFDAWRSSLETRSILVFLFPMGSQSAQGFSLWDKEAPVIAVNTAWNDAARVFTLFHEFGHLLTRTSSVCLEHSGSSLRKPNDRAERWCERFSAAIVLPWSDVADFLGRRFNWSPGEVIDDLSVPRAIANAFKVSWRAATIRLIERRAATWDLYAEIPRYTDEKQKTGGGGGGRNRTEIREDQYGRRATDLFLSALDAGVLGRADVLEYLDITDSGLSQLQGVASGEQG